MAEEIKDAGLNVPNAMVWSYVLNEFLATILLVTYLFAMPSVSDALNDPTYCEFAAYSHLRLTMASLHFTAVVSNSSS